MSSHNVTLSATSLLNCEISLISNYSSTRVERLLQSVLPSVRASENETTQKPTTGFLQNFK